MTYVSGEFYDDGSSVKERNGETRIVYKRSDGSEFEVLPTPSDPDILLKIALDSLKAQGYPKTTAIQ